MSSRPGIGVWELPERFVRRAQGITLTRVSFHGMTPQALSLTECRSFRSGVVLQVYTRLR